MSKYSVIAGATNFLRKKYEQTAEDSATYVITVSNEVKEAILDGDAFTTSVELNDLEFKRNVIQRSSLKGWRITIQVNSGLTLLVGKIIGVKLVDVVENVETTLATCLMSNGSYLTLSIGYNIVTKAFTCSLSSEGAVGGGDITIDKIVSGEEPLGKAILSDGEGGATWGDVNTFKSFPSTWVVNGTTAEFCASVDADDDATEGNAYLGEVTFSDLPASLVNAECKVEIYDDTKVIHLVVTSGNVAPYRWEYTYWNSGSNVSGWIGFQNELPTYTTLDIGKSLVLESDGNSGVQMAWGTITSGDYANHNIAPTYDATATYLTGDLVIYNDNLYSAKQDISVAESWDSSHWEQTTIADAVLGALNTGV